MVLGRRADHRRTADIDVLDGLLLAHPGVGDRLFERIEVHANEVDRLDPLVLERLHVVGQVPPRQQRRVQPWVERLDPSAKDLRRAGELRDVGHLESRVAQRRGRAARGQDLDIEVAQRPGEVHDARLVGDGDKRALDLYRGANGRRSALFCDR